MTFHSICQLLRPSAWTSFVACFVGGVIAAKEEMSEVTTWKGVVALIGFCAVQGAAFGMNQCFDAPTDCLQPGKSSPIVTKAMTVRQGLAISLILLVIGGGALGVLTHVAWPILGLTVLLIAYSEPHLRLKGRFGLDIASNGLGGALSFLSGWAQVTILSSPSLLMAGAIGLAYAGGYPFHCCVDYEADKASGVRTTCVRIGRFPAVILGSVLFVLAAIMCGMAMYWAGLIDSCVHCLPLLFVIFIPLWALRLGGAGRWKELHRQVLLLNYLGGIAALWLVTWCRLHR